ncbi:MAG: oxidoreductase-like domain-containing protein [Hydrogenophaga sp.]|nr:oxidoreductase-like domain-containing protein [Hydrogenophaga sp.]
MFQELLLRAAGAGITLRKPPSEPTTCCGRGCNGCVWEGFMDAAEYWRQEALLQLQG